MLTTTYELVDGKSVRIGRLGSGPPVVLLHGYPDTLQIWSALAPLLAATHEVIAFDWPGMGESEAWSGGATPFDLGRRLIRLLDHLDIAQATLLGHDMGAPPALAIAATEPSRVARVVVLNSLVMPDERTSWEIEVLRRFRINRLLLRHAPRLVFHRALATSVSALPRAVRDELWHQFARRDAREFIIRMCAGYQGALPKLATMYDRISVPVTIVWGARDHHFPPIQAERLHERIAGSTLTIIEGGEHWMAWSRAREVADAVLRHRDHVPVDVDLAEREAEGAQGVADFSGVADDHDQ